MWFFVADLAFLCRLLLCCASSSFFTLLLCYWCLGYRHARKMLGLTWLNLLNQSDRNYNFRLGNLIMIFCIGVTHPFASWRTVLRAVHRFVGFASATKSCHLWEVQLHMTQDEARAHFREARNLLRISSTSTCFFLSRSHWLCLSLVTRLESFHHMEMANDLMKNETSKRKKLSKKNLSLITFHKWWWYRNDEKSLLFHL